MTELQLYKFIQDNQLDIDWRGDELILWVDFSCAHDFAHMIHLFLSDGGEEVNLQRSSIALDIVPLCEFYDIEPENILAREANA